MFFVDCDRIQWSKSVSKWQLYIEQWIVDSIKRVIYRMYCLKKIWIFGNLYDLPQSPRNCELSQNKWVSRQYNKKLLALMLILINIWVQEQLDLDEPVAKLLKAMRVC